MALPLVPVSKSAGNRLIRPRPVLTSLTSSASAQRSSPPGTQRLLTGRSLQTVRSCQECRRRKIRCNRGRPCSYCVKNHIACAYSQRNQLPRCTNHESSPSVLSDRMPVNLASQNDLAASRPLRVGLPDGHEGFTSSAFPFLSKSLATNLQPLHPTPERIFSLWQTYVENVDPLLKIFHTPTVQRQIIQASHELGQAPPSEQALMFSIYYAALTSMRCRESQAQLQEDRNLLLERYRFGIEQALAMADFLASPNLTLLQAFVLYLICARLDNDGPHIWTLTGLAIRIALKLGLHRDQVEPASALPHYEIEMRRRLWWQICVLDVRTALDSGMDPSLYEHMFSVGLPLNVDDADLDHNMSGPPTEISGRTEMLLSLVRIESSFAARKILFSKHFCEYNSYPLTSLEEKIKLLNDLQRRLEDVYLKFCDLDIPSCVFTVATVGLVLRKLKLVVVMKGQTNPASLPQAAHDDLFKTRIEILESMHTLQSNQNLQRWSWLFEDYVEWEASTSVLYSICERVRGAEVDRAWSAINAIFKSRQASRLDESTERRWRHVEKLRLKAIAIYHQALIEESRDALASVAPSIHGAPQYGDDSTGYLSSCGSNLGNHSATARESSSADIHEHDQPPPARYFLNKHARPVDATTIPSVTPFGTQASPDTSLLLGCVRRSPVDPAPTAGLGNFFQDFPVQVDDGLTTCWL